MVGPKEKNNNKKQVAPVPEATSQEHSKDKLIQGLKEGWHSFTAFTNLKRNKVDAEPHDQV
jgi:hypothetical protein